MRIKSILFFICLGCLLLTVGACNNTETEMTIQPAELTAAEENLLTLTAGNAAYIFDYTIDENAQSATLQTYQLDENNQWQPLQSGRLSLSDTGGRIALCFDGVTPGISLSLQENNGDNFRSHQQTKPTTAEESNGESTSILTAPISITYEKEIPLGIQVFSENGTLTSYDVSAFFAPAEYLDGDGQQVYAATILFSQHPLE